MLLARLPAPLKPAAMLLVQPSINLEVAEQSHMSMSPNNALHRDALVRFAFRKRLERPRPGWLDATTMLRHFCLINYAIPTERLAAVVPQEFFEIAKFETEEGPRSFVSVVPFLDFDFNFPRLAPWFKFSFYQTNHRAYVIDKRTGQHAVWFFGTNLGSPLVYLPRLLWKIPWHYTSYSADCRYSRTLKRYENYSYNFESEWCSGRTSIRDTGEPIQLMPGFASLDEMKLILTHPVRGYYRGLDGKIGTYGIWHKEMECTRGIPENLYYSLYERLGIMSKDEMLRPHSVFMCPEIEFDIHLPPTPLPLQLQS